MIVVKITILLVVITLIVRFLIESYLRSDKLEALQVAAGVTKWYTVTFGVLALIDIIGIVVSTIYLLFFK